MSYKPYPKYKPSGVEWMGAIPAGWNSLAIKRLSSVKRGASPRPIDDPKYFNDFGEFAWVRIADVSASERYLKKTKQQLSELGSSLSVKRQPGDIFLSIAGSVGKPIITKIKCCIHDGFVYFPELNVNPEYLYYLFITGLLFKGLGKWGTQLNLNTETVGDVTIPMPSKVEIDNIITFLDRKTAQIDKLIKIKRKQIELLKEERTAIINQAVTKGLNPDAKMKDSGVEWIGEIPEGWSVKRLKFIAQVRGGATKGRKLPASNSIKLPYLRVANVQDGYLNLSYMKEIEILKSEISRYKLEVGDVLMNEGGDFDKLGRGAVWHGKISPCLHQNHVFAVRPSIEGLSDWISLFTQTDSAKKYFVLNAKQTTNLASISSSNIKELPVVFPPKKDRDDIVQFINIRTVEIDETISKAEQQIKLLKEYRTTLISDAVTGKIDIREEAA